MSNPYPIKCYWCGRFCSGEHWEEEPFSGCVEHLDPPDMVPVCDRCFDESKKQEEDKNKPGGGR